jgi:hypothetical protein
MTDDKRRTDRVGEAVEDAHRSLADLPFAVLECLDLFEKTALQARSSGDTSVGAIHDLVRDINARLAEFADELSRGCGDGG